MEIIKCLNCGKHTEFKKIEVNSSLKCECGCFQICLGVESDTSRWRVMNPFSFEDKRNNNQ